MKVKKINPLHTQPSRTLEERRIIQRLLDAIRAPGDHRDEIADLVNRLWRYEPEPSWKG
jgi:hypothetical protein